MAEYIADCNKELPEECESCDPCIELGCKHVHRTTARQREEIVRCKDCSKCEIVTTKKGTMYSCTEFECPFCGSFVDVDEFGYCAWGERREE